MFQKKAKSDVGVFSPALHASKIIKLETYFNLSTPLVAHDIILCFLWLMLSQMKRRKPTDTEHVYN